MQRKSQWDNISDKMEYLGGGSPLKYVHFMHKEKPVCLWWKIETGRPGWLVGFTKAGVDERVLHKTTADSKRQIMLVRLLRWAHQQPTAWPIRAERKLHNNDCSTLPEDSARTTTIHLSWFALYREFRVDCRSKQMRSSRQKVCPPHQLYAPGNPERDLWDCVQSYNAEHSS